MGLDAELTATEITVTDSLRYETKDGRGRDHPALETTSRSIIRAKLRPGTMRKDKIWGSEPTYSMFGTDRRIEFFQLDIMAATADQAEGCTAWGSVSYTSEIDFRSDTSDDIIQFYLMVPQTTYDRYVWNIAQGMCDALMLSLGHVDGFYSEWSPSISTNSIKVLVGSEHVVDGAASEVLPRLGNVGQSDLTMAARRTLIKAASDGEGHRDNDQGVSPADSKHQGFKWPGKR